MKPQATRIRNRQKQKFSAILSKLKPLLAALQRLRLPKVRVPTLRVSGVRIPGIPHPHVKWSAIVLGCCAFVALCVQGITVQRYEPSSDAWQAVNLSLDQPEKNQIVPAGEIQPQLNESIFKVKNGDSLSLVFARAGYGSSIVHRVAYTTEHGKALSRIFPGQEIRFYTDQDDQLAKIELTANELEFYRVETRGDSFVSSRVVQTPSIFPRVKSGTINSSFYLAGQSAGLTDNQIMELASIFGWDIDFVLEIREGDSFTLVYEERFLNGAPISDGNILAAEFINQKRVFRAIRYEHSDGHVAYYNPDGASMRKAFLRSPLDVFRISSHFNLNRKHPILNTIRAHKGTDYAAPTGTPIKAAGDGRVTYAAADGGYGNVVRIQHGQSYQTTYAHMSRFASGIKKGTHVRQGQTIGYVGSSGLATGPHLHYEFRLNGAVRNPVTVDLPDGDPISTQELASFNLTAQPLVAMLESPVLNQQYANLVADQADDI